MTRLVLPALLLAFTVGCGPASSQNDPDRAALILANLKHEFPQLERVPASVDSLRPSGIDGLDEGVLTVQGDGQPFYVTRDNTKLFLLAAPAVDVSRSADELVAAATARTEAAAEEARTRGDRLAAAVAGLPVRGNPDAPVTIVEFSDFQCPYCKLASATVEQILAQYPNDVKLVYAHYPLGNHAWAEPAAVASTCAAQQLEASFWTLHDAYFDEQRAFTEANVMDRSRAALSGSGLDMAAWTACTANPATAAAVRTQAALGDEYGVSGTPAFFVNGRFINGNQPLETFVAAIEEAKAAQ